MESEKVLHKRLVKKIKAIKDIAGIDDFVFFHIKNDVGRRKGNFFYDLLSLGVLGGVPDFCFFTGKGVVVFLEIKSEKGRLSENQKKFFSRSSRLGVKVFVAYGWKQIEKAVENILSDVLSQS